jgi:uncharacterized protein YndB with AHSA1/START domain
MAVDRVERMVRGEITVPGTLEQVWKAWTTDRGAEGFFAPECHIDLRPGGLYEIFFNPQAEPGLRGSEKMIVLAVQPMKMLSFTWNSPPELPEVRGQMTHMLVRFTTVDAEHTRVTLVHDGWGEGGQWEQAYQYFNFAWLQVVLPRLQYCFLKGPINWDKPPSMDELGKVE